MSSAAPQIRPKGLQPKIELKLFQKERRARWLRFDLPFNPKESWKGRNRRLCAAPASPFFVGDPLHITLSDGLRQGVQSMARGRWLFFFPDAKLSPFAPQGALDWASTSRRCRKWLNTVARVLGSFVTLKLKYKGKSFRWHRKLRSILLRFGHSHLLTVKPKPNTFWRKHGRMKIIFWGANPWYLKKFLQASVKWRPMNTYHGRGLRITKQKVLRKSGKVSAYR